MLAMLHNFPGARSCPPNSTEITFEASYIPTTNHNMNLMVVPHCYIIFQYIRTINILTGYFIETSSLPLLSDFLGLPDLLQLFSSENMLPLDALPLFHWSVPSFHLVPWLPHQFVWSKWHFGHTDAHLHGSDTLCNFVWERQSVPWSQGSDVGPNLLTSNVHADWRAG